MFTLVFFTFFVVRAVISMKNSSFCIHTFSPVNVSFNVLRSWIKLLGAPKLNGKAHHCNQCEQLAWSPGDSNQIISTE